MKKIIFVAQSLRIGGAQRALINQLNDLDKSKYEVSLFLYSCSGEYIDLLDDRIKIIKSNFLLTCIGKTLTESYQEKKYFIIRNMMAVLTKIFGSDRVFQIIFKRSKKLYGYDLAVSYHHNISNDSLYFGYNKFVLNNIAANKKIAWIHSDYINAKLNNDLNQSEYEKMDYVVNVSYAMKNRFDKMTGIEKSKSKVIYNILPVDQIMEESQEYDFSNYDDRFNILTLCRMDSNKSVLELCEIARRLLQKGYLFYWHFVGEGPLYKKVKHYAREYKLEKTIILHGFVANPYPILRKVNLLVSGSKSETFGMSITESLALNTPVIALCYPAITEIINDSNGIVVRDFGEMTHRIQKLMRNEEYYHKLQANSKLMIDYNSNNREVLDEILGDSYDYHCSNRINDVLVTVVIPTYRRPTYLTRAMNSVRNQSYQNLEIIVVDDNNEGDSYRTETELIMVRITDSRVRYMKHESNRNGSAARNTGMNHAHGKYITFLDDDDEFEEDKILEQVKCMEALGDDWVACYTLMTRYRAGSLIDKSTDCKSGNLYLDCFKNELYLNAGSNLLIRTQVVKELGGFDDSFRRMEDLEFLIRVAERGKISCIPHYLLKINIHKNQIKVDYDNLLSYTEHFFNRFEAKIKILDNNDRKEIYQSKYLDLLRLMLKDKKYLNSLSLIKSKKLGAFLVLKYLKYLLMRRVTKKCFGFKFD